MKCFVCGHRKGKRSCPAGNALICAQCCGEKRVLEIDCPETCGYLAEGRAREGTQERQRQIRGKSQSYLMQYERTTSRFKEFLSLLEYNFGDERRVSRDLKDLDVAEALDLLLKTLRTEERGILYEQTSGDLRVEALRRRIRDVVETQRHPQQQQQDPYSIAEAPESMKLGDVIECLQFLRDLVEEHLKDPAALSYVDLLYRLLPRGETVHDSAPSIIVPGR
jgi:hypothetical protein